MQNTNHGKSKAREHLSPLTLPQAIPALALPPNTTKEELEEAWRREEQQSADPIAAEQETVRRLQEEREQEAGEEVSPAKGNAGMSDNPFIVNTPSGMPAVPSNHPGEPWI